MNSWGNINPSRTYSYNRSQQDALFLNFILVNNSTWFGHTYCPSSGVLILYSNIYPTRCNFTQFIYIWKLFFMFRVVSPPIIRSTYNCIYNICYLSNRYCYLMLSWKSWTCRSNSSTIAAGSSNGLTNTRYCRYSCMRSWWWVDIPPETCRTVSRYK